ncbi:MAG: hypothetical protein ACK5X3_05710, partial [Pseudomonadota bacterium]
MLGLNNSGFEVPILYATKDGIYVVGNDTIVSFYFFNEMEKKVFEYFGPKNIKEFYKHMTSGKGLQDLQGQN